MLAKLEQNAALLGPADLNREKHVLFVLPRATSLDAFRGVPGLESLRATLARRGKKPEELASAPIQTDLPRGTLGVWTMQDSSKSMFERQTLMRKAVAMALAEKPEALAIAVSGTPAQRRVAAELASYTTWVNGVRLPERKKKPDGRALRRIRIYGHAEPAGFMVGGDDDQRIPRVFAIKFIGQAHGAVELSIIVNHRGNVVGVRGAIDIFRLDKSEKAARPVQQANCRLCQIEDRRFILLVAIDLNVHFH